MLGWIADLRAHGKPSRIAITPLRAFSPASAFPAPRRWTTEVASEGLTLLAGGLVVLYAAAVPALVEFDESKINAVKYSVKFIDRNGNEIGKRGIMINDAVPLDEIPDHLIKATLATEDRRFFEHYRRRLLRHSRAPSSTNVNAGETVQGGSTLTQQLRQEPVPLLRALVHPQAQGSLLSRSCSESRLTKREILKLYLDRAYMGGGAFGVEAASQFYFGKSVRDVTLAEAAMMAGLFKAPTKYAPHANLANARAPRQRRALQSRRRRLHDRRPGRRTPAAIRPRADRKSLHHQPRLVPRLGLRGSRSGSPTAKANSS